MVARPESTPQTALPKLLMRKDHTPANSSARALLSEVDGHLLSQKRDFSMRVSFVSFRILAVVAPLVASIACGNSSSPLQPTSVEAPAAVETPVAVASGATIAGTVSSDSPVVQSLRRSLDVEGVVVTVEDTKISATVAADGTFTLLDVPAMDVVLDFSAPDMTASIPIGVVGSSDHVKIGVTLSGGTATLDSLTIVSSNTLR